MTTATRRQNVHGTAVVVGTSGLIFVGGSGSGKSERAFACLEEAARRGLFSALVADDQVYVAAAGGLVLAEAPPATAGRIELRGSGIARVRTLPRAVLHLAVLCVGPGEPPRLPDGEEAFDLAGVGTLPLLRLPRGAAGLPAIAALFPQLLRW